MSKKNNDKNYEYIRGRFDSDGINAPGSLSEESIMEKLGSAGAGAEADEYAAESTGKYTRAAVRRSLTRRIAMIAACAIMVIAGIPAAYKIATAPPDVSVRNGELYTFSSQTEIERLIRSMEHSSGFSLFGLGSSRDGAATATSDVLEYETEDAAESGIAVSKNSASGGPEADHSDTYLQVEEVDEADIVKTDGSYIYYVNENAEVVIMRASEGKTKILSRISNTGVENYIDDIFLKGDYLVTVGTVYEEKDDEGSTGIAIYDISDRKNPELVNVFRQSGSIVSSRMVGDYVYLVTNEYVYNGGRVIPRCGFEGDYRNLDAEDICCIPDPKQTSYVILSAVDIASGKQSRSRTKAVFGATDNIYCNDHNLYTASGEWDDSTNRMQTRIVRAGINGLDVRFNATTVVRGYINDQFSMDESGGYLRIATTSERGGMNVNNLFVLDSKLKEAGSVTGFARNESIKAVRFIGTRAYVITYEAIDPLFVIDLTDPEYPRIEGEVKIDGFSSLLVPVSDNRLLGIGYATGDNGYGGEYSAGLKLALFDVSDPAEPKVISSKEFKDMDSPAQLTHKALIVNRKAGWYAVPYGVYHYETEASDDDTEEDDWIEDNSSYEAGMLVFGADDDINVIDRHQVGSSYIYRGVYIDSYIYALDKGGAAGSFAVGK